MEQGSRSADGQTTRRVLELLVGQALAWGDAVRVVTREAADEPHLAEAEPELRQLNVCCDRMLDKLEALACSREAKRSAPRREFDHAQGQLVSAWNRFVLRASRLRESA